MSPQKQALTLLDKQQTLFLSTQHPTGRLETSVTPFVIYEGCFYIFVSELAQHTQNLMALVQQTGDEQSNISGLITADESASDQPFARERMSFQFKVEELAREEQGYTKVLEFFTHEFGEVVAVLQGLPDFHLFKLMSIEGSYVRGFGQAFAFKGMPENGMKPIKR